MKAQRPWGTRYRHGAPDRAPQTLAALHVFFQMENPEWLAVLYIYFSYCWENNHSCILMLEGLPLPTGCRSRAICSVGWQGCAGKGLALLHAPASGAARDLLQAQGGVGGWIPALFSYMHEEQLSQGARVSQSWFFTMQPGCLSQHPCPFPVVKSQPEASSQTPRSACPFPSLAGAQGSHWGQSYGGRPRALVGGRLVGASTVFP